MERVGRGKTCGVAWAKEWTSEPLTARFREENGIFCMPEDSPKLFFTLKK
jgi:hypothetical protein